MSEFSITPDVYEKINDMGESYVYNDADFISAGETNGGTVNGTDSGGVNSDQLRNYVAKTGDQMSGNLITPLVQLNTLVFSDDSSMTTAVDNNDVQTSKTKTTQITYDGTSTNITNLTTGNFNTTFLSNMTENIQNAINTLKTKTTGVSYNNSVTTISNLNATTFTAGNINVNHLNATNSNLQSQITSINSTLNTLTIGHLTGTTSNLQTQINSLNAVVNQGSQYVYQSAGTFTLNVPIGTRWMSIVSIAGGGGAGGSSVFAPLAKGNVNAGGSGGGGGGMSKIELSSYNVSQISITVGAGGIGATNTGNGGFKGGDSFIKINQNTFCHASGGLGGGAGRSNGDWDLGGGSVSGGFGNFANGGASGRGGGFTHLDGFDGDDSGGTAGGAGGASIYRNFANVFSYGKGGLGGGFSRLLNSSNFTESQGGGEGSDGFYDNETPTVLNDGTVLDGVNVTAINGLINAEQGLIVGFYCGAGGGGGARYMNQSAAAPVINGFGYGGSAAGATAAGIPNANPNTNGSCGAVIIQFYY